MSKQFECIWKRALLCDFSVASQDEALLSHFWNVLGLGFRVYLCPPLVSSWILISRRVPSCSLKFFIHLPDNESSPALSSFGTQMKPTIDQSGFRTLFTYLVVEKSNPSTATAWQVHEAQHMIDFEPRLFNLCTRGVIKHHFNTVVPHMHKANGRIVWSLRDLLEKGVSP